MNLRFVRRPVAILAIALASAALTCSQEQEETAPTRTSVPRLTHVTANMNPSITYGPLMIAYDEGFFEDEGIEVEFVSLTSNMALAALVEGQLDVLSTGVRSSIFNMIERGSPIQVVVERGHFSATCSAEAFVAPDEMAKRIAAAGDDLSGERVAIVRGGMAEYLVSQLLARFNTTVDDVVAIALPHGTPVSSRDGVDAVRYIGEPQLSVLMSEGGSTVLATADEVAPDHVSAFILYGPRLLHVDPDLGKRFMRAYLRGVRQWNQGKSDRNLEIVARHTKLPVEILRNMCWTSTLDDGRIDPKKAQPFLDWALEKGYLDGPVTTEWWNPAFVDDAARTLASEQ